MTVRRRTLPIVATTLTLTAGAVAGAVISRPADAADAGQAVASEAVAMPKLGHWRNRPYDGSRSWRQRMDAAEAQFGPFAGHWRQFKPVGKSGELSTSEEQALADGKRLFSNWKPLSSGQTWATVAAGGNDARIQAAADDWARNCDDNDECWITFWHEPENNLGGSGWSTADHKAMFRRAAGIFRSRAPEVKIVWTMMGYEGHRALYPALWPGNEYVDYIGHDPYLKATTPPADLAKKIIDRSLWFRANISAKPIVIAEWGTDLSGVRGTAQHRADAVNEVRARLAEIAAAGVVELSHFDSREHYFSTPDLSGPDPAAYKALMSATAAGGTPAQATTTTRSGTSQSTSTSSSPQAAAASTTSTGTTSTSTGTTSTSTGTAARAAGTSAKPVTSAAKPARFTQRASRGARDAFAWGRPSDETDDVSLADRTVLVGDVSQQSTRNELTDTVLPTALAALLLGMGVALRRRRQPSPSGAHRRKA